MSDISLAVTVTKIMYRTKMIGNYIWKLSRGIHMFDTIDNNRDIDTILFVFDTPRGQVVADP